LLAQKKNYSPIFVDETFNSPLQHLKDNIMSKGFSFEIMEQYNLAISCFSEESQKKEKQKRKKTII